ncbi:hypothetical protein TIFTF001_007387 [Ficus carica]|uniref:Uncharacterized protein n=1 Tax=Ficus carica TaxID=3494 RepID=A0AA87ZRM0_FICCA|nr:hypothetical protein TIFTF001_007387 [Ficus carica]
MEATSFSTANKNNVVDVSSFFLFEATGDSESCSKSDPDIAEDGEDSVSHDDDDAESCSWDPADRGPSIGDSMDGGDAIDQESWNGGDDECDRDDDGGGVEEETGGTFGRRKSEVSVDSTTTEFESLNEMEKNRLFWETCLAS